MHPILGHLSVAGRDVPIGSYSAFMTLAWLVMVGIGTAVATVRGLPWARVLAVLCVSLVAGVIGARVLDVLVVGGAYAGNPSRVFALNYQGFSLYGGLVFGSLAAIGMARLLRVPVWRVADSAVPGLAIGIVLMRVGCFLCGCCFGRVTGLPWGVTFPPGSPAWAQQFASGQSGILGIAGLVGPVHPTQLYEAGAAVILCALGLWLLVRVGTPDGVAFLVFAIGLTLFREGNGFLRADAGQVIAPWWFYHAVYAAIVAVLTVLLVSRARAGASRTPPPLP